MCPLGGDVNCRRKVRVLTFASEHNKDLREALNGFEKRDKGRIKKREKKRRLEMGIGSAKREFVGKQNSEGSKEGEQKERERRSERKKVRKNTTWDLYVSPTMERVVVEKPRVRATTSHGRKREKRGGK